MNSKYSNQDLVNATLEIYGEFEKSYKLDNTNKIKKKKNEPLLLSKEVKTKKNTKKQRNLNLKSSKNKKISNRQRLNAYKKKRQNYKKKETLRLNKIIKFESKKYLFLYGFMLILWLYFRLNIYETTSRKHAVQCQITSIIFIYPR